MSQIMHCVECQAHANLEVQVTYLKSMVSYLESVIVEMKSHINDVTTTNKLNFKTDITGFERRDIECKKCHGRIYEHDSCVACKGNVCLMEDCHSKCEICDGMTHNTCLDSCIGCKKMVCIFLENVLAVSRKIKCIVLIVLNFDKIY